MKLNNIYKNVSDVKCKDYYRHLIRRKKIPATAVAKWETMYDNVEFDWSDIYCCAFENTRETHKVFSTKRSTDIYHAMLIFTGGKNLKRTCVVIVD